MLTLKFNKVSFKDDNFDDIFTIMKGKQKWIDILNYRGLYDLSKKDITYGDINGI